MKIPERFTDVKYEDVPKKIQGLFESMKDSKRGIFIHGPVGTGKTHFAYALKQKWDIPSNIEKGQIGRSARFYNTTELLREIRKDFDRDAMEKRHLADELMSNEDKVLLFLDDLGSEKMTDWVGETFYLIINSRYNNVMPTIFTSNFGIPDLAERIGDRTVSRIVEMCDVVELVGSDRRTINIKKIPIKV